MQSAGYKFCNLTLFIRQRRKIKNINNISLKFMLTDNWFVIIHCLLIKVSAQIIQSIIFEFNELSITLSTLCMIIGIVPEVAVKTIKLKKSSVSGLAKWKFFLNKRWFVHKLVLALCIPGITHLNKI